MDFERDFAKLTEKLRDSKSVSIPVTSLESEEEVFIYGLVTKSLSYVDQTHLDGTLQLVVSELLRNAEKAVMKRAFAEFFAKEEDVDRDDFLNSFHTKYRDDAKSLRSQLRKAKPGFEFVAEIGDAGLDLTVMNYATPTTLEDSLIRDRLSKGSAAAGLNQLALPEMKTHEGDGCGLALGALALNSAKLRPCVYKVEGGETAFRVHVPRGVVDQEVISRIDQMLLSEIDSLPAFPQNIRKMIELCNSPESDIKALATEIGTDAVIAGQIIKLANSGGFAGGKVASIGDAVKILGLANIAGLLMQVGAYSILEEKYGSTGELLAHPVRVATISRNLARKYKMGALADQAYVGGLLHDIGKIVILAHLKKKDVAHSIEKIGKRRDRRTQVDMEEIACGANHALVGKLLAAKWNFPDQLAEAIGCHHAPLASTQDRRKLVFTVYLANAFADYEDERTVFYAIEPEVLAFFNLTTETTFEMLASSLSV